MSAFDAYLGLVKAGCGRIFAHENMSKHTTFRIGGPATAYVCCDTYDELASAIKIIDDCRSPWTLVGKGSNLLVADEGYDGIILTLGKEFRQFFYSSEGVITCGAAVSLGRLVQEAFKSGLSGFEFAVGIPGSFGGAVFMNAGTKDATIGQVIKSVVVHNPDGGLYRYKGEELPWHYRYSGIPKNEIILEAEIFVKQQPKSFVQAKMEGSLKRRKKSQPGKFPNAGSVFRNPEGGSAGELIEQAGLKGLSVGGASISDTHANFIINKSNASANDVIELMIKVQDRVKEVYGIQLQPEIRFIGF